MLKIVATPIGNLKDVSLRALDSLKECDLVIGEEFRVASTLLKKLEIPNKEIYLLNEHSKKVDIDELTNFCRTQNVVLISDCGTPGFSDPGAELIASCRKNKIPVTSLPGASSLMTLLSLSSKKLTQFIFVGFLPAKSTERKSALRDLKSEKRSWIIMDTPYRLTQILEDLSTEMPNERGLLALNMTQENELLLEGTFKEIKSLCKMTEAEFMILRYGI